MTQGERPTPDKHDSLEGIRRQSLLTLLVLSKGERRGKRVWNAFRDSLGRNASVRDIEQQLLQPIQRRARSGFLTRDESHYLISDIVSRNRRVRAAEHLPYAMIDERRTQRGAEYGIASDDDWDEHEVPDEYQRLTSVWLDLRNRIEAEWLESSGEVETARLLRTAVGAYVRRQIRRWSTMFGGSREGWAAREEDESGGEGL